MYQYQIVSDGKMFRILTKPKLWPFWTFVRRKVDGQWQALDFETKDAAQAWINMQDPWKPVDDK
jgi:hypothetical protein